jgi:formate dehydrogenase major subunit
VPLRSGTDIAFLGGMMKYIIDKGLYEKFYVENYTNAAFIVGEGFEFKDGMFSGYDPATKKYDQKKWAFAMDDKGVPKKDPTLKDPRCVFQLLKKHYSRYNLDDVSAITGVSKENLLKVYDAYAATGKPDKAGTMMYALGWTQHSVGVQNIRLGAMIQLMLGNIGVAGGGVNALRGEPNVQGSTDHAILCTSSPATITCPARPGRPSRTTLRATPPRATTPRA